MSQSFRLEPMLKLREQTRDERRRELAPAYEAQRILEDQLAEISSEQETSLRHTRRLAAPGELSVEGLLNSRRYESQLKSRVAELQQQMSQVLAEVERRRILLMEADRDVKVLEKLREREREQQVETARKREGKQLDEAALRGYLREREVLR